jgi:DNA-binding helix-hairpin-helix protein with protein kinase domain
MVLSMNVPVVPVLALWVAYPRMYLFKSALRRERKAASRSLQALRERWEKEAGLDLFTDKWKELEQRMRDYNGLARERKARIDDLHNQQRSRQLAVYLQQYCLEDAKIAGLGSSKKTNLASFGIETAADLTDEAIKQVPGFGPSTGRRLLSWRQSLEKGCVYAQVQTISQSDLFAVDKEIAAKRAKLEQELRDGPAQLKQIADRIKASRGDLWPQVEASAKALAQIEADLRAL